MRGVAVVMAGVLAAVAATPAHAQSATGTVAIRVQVLAAPLSVAAGLVRSPASTSAETLGDVSVRVNAPAGWLLRVERASGPAPLYPRMSRGGVRSVQSSASAVQARRQTTMVRGAATGAIRFPAPLALRHDRPDTVLVQLVAE